jgi:hypothetical protein
MSANTKRWQDKSWRYYPSEDTDVSRTFRRIRQQMKEAAKAPPANVKPIKSKETKRG